MKAILKNISSPDIDVNLVHYDKGDVYCFPVEVLIGPDNEDGAEIFQFIVCSPEWFVSQEGNINFFGEDIC